MHALQMQTMRFTFFAGNQKYMYQNLLIIVILQEDRSGTMCLEASQLQKWVRCWWGTKSLPYLLAIITELLLFAQVLCRLQQMMITMNGYTHIHVHTHTRAHICTHTMLAYFIKTLQKSAREFHEQMKRRHLHSPMCEITISLNKCIKLCTFQEWVWWTTARKDV